VKRFYIIKLITILLACQFYLFGQGAIEESESSVADNKGLTSEALLSAKKDLDEALKKRSEVFAQIGSEKNPLLKELGELEDKVAALQKEFVSLQRDKLARRSDLFRLNQEVSQYQAGVDYVKSVFKEFNLNFPTRIHAAEQQLYEEELKSINDKTSNGLISDQDELIERLKIVDIAFQRIEENVGGRIFSGQALTEKGENVNGTFGLMGPVAYFADASGAVAGVTRMIPNQSNVSVANLGEDRAEGIKSFVEGKESTIPIDATLGQAITLESSKETVVEHIAKGQMVGFAIIMLGILSLAIAGFKWWEISKFNVPTPIQINAILDDLSEGDQQSALKKAAAIPGKAGEMVVVAVEHFDGKRRLLEELLYEKLLSIRPKLERFLPFLAVTAAAAPLMGLLGTVMGMIKTFKLITKFGTGDARTLSSGISEALVTTELGLVVAIPILIIHGIMMRMSKGKVGSLEATALAFMNGLSENEELSNRGNFNKPSAENSGNNNEPNGGTPVLEPV